MDQEFIGNNTIAAPKRSMPEYSAEEILGLPALIAMTALILAIGGALTYVALHF